MVSDQLQLFHVIFVIGRVFVCVELSNAKIVIKIVSSNCFCHLIFISICRGSTVDYSGVTLLVLKFERTNKTKR